jgi:purine-binding chemotaxis protein CheW
MVRTDMALAGVIGDRGPDEHIQQYLTFMLAGEVFATGILAIKEIIEYANLTEVPMMPQHVRGVINLRGSVVIVEIVANGARQVVGVVVDAVNAVLDIPSAQIEPPPTFGSRIRTDFIQGMGKVNGGFVIVIDVSRILAADEMQVLAEAQETAATEAA